jgi:putative SOS response-associated peptidase YedK
MCGRYFDNVPRDEIAAAFRVDPGDLALEPHFNVAPGQEVPVVRFDAKHEARTIQLVHWGLVPHFAKDRKVGWKHINARAETVDTSPSFRSGFAKRRCLVVASGFFEWKKLGKRRLPYAIARDDRRPLGLAGVLENWKDPQTGEWLRSCAIITTHANALLATIHDRMPVIIEPEDYARWLGEEPGEPAQLKALLAPSAEGTLTMWPVSPRMNKADVDEPSLLEPVAEPDESSE